MTYGYARISTERQATVGLEKTGRSPPFSEGEHNRLMPDYRRKRVRGRTYFFTVNLLDR